MILKIALTNLNAYNNGDLIFEWLELPTTEKKINKTLQNIGVMDNDNNLLFDYFISDYESDIDNFKISEDENIFRLNETCEQLENFYDYEIETIEAILKYDAKDIEDAIERYNSGKYTYYQGMKDFSELAEQFVADGLYGEIPEPIRYYIDYNAIGSELYYSGEFVQIDKGILQIYR